MTMRRWGKAHLVGGLLIVASLVWSTVSGEAAQPCPPAMVWVASSGMGAYCIDRWEAHVVEVRGKREIVHASTQSVKGLRVKAVSRAGVKPQGYISQVEAAEACRAARKRLCRSDEWDVACRGPRAQAFPYGNERKSGYCNDIGRAPLAQLHPELGPAGVYGSADAMNDPRINAAPHTVAPAGMFAKCKSSYGVFDMVGNLHEWVADVHDGSKGVFRGGYYQDTQINGEGCSYRTVAHDVTYHDYSTGFRCCADSR